MSSINPVSTVYNFIKQHPIAAAAGGTILIMLVLYRMWKGSPSSPGLPPPEGSTTAGSPNISNPVPVADYDAMLVG